MGWIDSVGMLVISSIEISSYLMSPVFSRGVEKIAFPYCSRINDNICVEPTIIDTIATEKLVMRKKMDRTSRLQH